MKYLWTQDVNMPQFKPLDKNISVDVLIIGGGMAGILSALKLHSEGVNYALVEAKTIGNGITKGTTAVISAQHDTLYSDIIQKIGVINARLYLQANLSAVKSFKSLSTVFDCDFEEKPSIMYSQNDKSLMEAEVKKVRALGFPAEFTCETNLPINIAGAVKYPDMAQFHPLKFLSEASKGLHIYENTFVKSLDGTTAFTDKYKISAKKVIVATHFPFINSHGLYFMKLYQKRSFVIALENAKSIDCTMVDHAENGMYFRNYKNLLLVGGGDHRTGKKGGSFNELRQFAKKNFPNATEKYAWATQDCMSLDGMPYIGRYSKNLPNVFVASGFNEWGMTSSMVAASILTDMLAGRKNQYEAAFMAHRTMLSTQLFANMGNTLLDFAYPTTKRCSHLGCALKWNKLEHSWDCPCHGSRFEKDGKIINNPAMRDIDVK